jgi:aquaporin Z
MRAKLLAEAIGTFALLFTIGLARVHADVLSPVAVGTVLMALVYAGKGVSGAHYNPAVTIAVWMRGALPAREIAPYIAAQLGGALLAAFLTFKFAGFPIHIAPEEGVSALKAVTGEAIFAFLLVYVILQVVFTRSEANNSYYGLAIGGTVMAGAFALADITGAAFNPAVGLMPALFESFMGFGGYAPTPLAWVYAVGPVLGGVVAALAHQVMHPEPAAA